MSDPTQWDAGDWEEFFENFEPADRADAAEAIGEIIGDAAEGNYDEIMGDDSSEG